MTIQNLVFKIFITSIFLPVYSISACAQAASDQSAKVLFVAPANNDIVQQFPFNSVKEETHFDIEEKKHGHQFPFPQKNKQGWDSYVEFKTVFKHGDTLRIWEDRSGFMVSKCKTNWLRQDDIPYGLCIIRNNHIIAIYLIAATCII